MAKKISVFECGGVEKMVFTPFEPEKPHGKQVLVRHTAIGVNFIDIYHRRGFYPRPEEVFGLGGEAAGVVEAVGTEVEYLMVGDRVVYAKGGIGAYATHRLMDEEDLVMLPPEITDIQAAALMLKGLTAHYLVRKTFEVHERMVVLVQAAAGGVGLLLSQWVRGLGAGVIGVVGSEEKKALASEAGCHHVFTQTDDDVVAQVRELTAGKGVNLVYDGVGKDTFYQSLDCLMRFGLLVSYGQSSGAIPAFDVLELSRRGSLFLTRPTLYDYIADYKDYTANAEELFAVVKAGYIKKHIHAVYPLEEVAQAHLDLESRKTTGALVLVP